ncbi:regulator of chromosome condensation 1/beta-lactamase-inhibitor protein II [Dichotomocladium elegans]|nr:regulator of chromosome condensation 1/beta-lactamase-inhibitor protein II [Dichotomocladium elegans]
MKLSELPIDIIDQILSLLPIASLLGLSETCWKLYTLCNADCVWHGRVTTDFGLARFMHQLPYGSSKQFYQALAGALQTFAWGENSDRQLGFGDQYNPFQHMFLKQIHFPRELRAMRGKAIAKLVAGEKSFHALDRRGQVWMWGLMQTRIAEDTPSLVPTQPYQMDDLPSSITSIASSKFHCIAADRVSGRAWHWAHGHAPRELALVQPIQQVAAHRSFSTLLSSQGIIWFVPSPPLSPSQPAVLTSSTPADPFTHLAGMLDSGIALTRSGRVFRISPRSSSSSNHNRSDTQNDGVKVSMDGFASAIQVHGRPVSLSAHFHNFAICTRYGSALIGTQHQRQAEQPLRILHLNGQSIVKIIFGIHHYGALTDQGRLLTWGQHHSGALGRGFDGMGEDEGEEQEVPKLVDKLANMFVIDAAFGADYSGCTAFPRELLQKITSS